MFNWVESEAVKTATGKLTNDIEDELRLKLKEIERVLSQNDLLAFKFLTLDELQIVLFVRKRD